jgi:O-antigen ligase
MKYSLSAATIFAIALIILLSAIAPRALTILPGLAGLGFSVSHWRQGKRFPLLPVPLFGFCAVAVLLGALSSLWAIDPEMAFERSWKTALVLLPCLLFIAAVQAVDAAQVRRYLWLIPAAVTAAAIIVAINMGFEKPFYRLLNGIDFTTPIKDNVLNRAAVSVALCYLPALSLTSHIGRKWLWRTVMTAPMVAIFFLTESQAFQVILALGLAVMLLFPMRSRIAWGLMAGAICAGAALAPWIAIGAFGLLTSEAQNIPMHYLIGGANLGSRMEIWDFISHYALQNPLYGFGMEAARAVPKFDTAELYHHASTILHPHNFALQLWIEFGVAGAALGIALLLYIIRGLYTLFPAQRRTALPPFIACLATASFTYGLWQSWWLGLLFLIGGMTILAIKTAAPETGSGHVLSD